jgi:hypothetical protein
MPRRDVPQTWRFWSATPATVQQRESAASAVQRKPSHDRRDGGPHITMR